MFLKERTEPRDLLIMRYLKPRMKLSSKDEIYYWTLEKGYQGELQFDSLMVENLPGNKLIVNDLLLQHNQTYFQIDSLIFSQSSLYLCDVKSFEKDIYVEGNKWKTLSGSEINNPLHQLERCEILLSKLLQEIGYRNIPIKPYLIFINPQFSLYKAPPNQSIVLPNQIPRFMDQLKNETSITTENNLKLLRNLINLHVANSPFSNVPNYIYGNLRKGITCTKCTKFVSVVSDKILVCLHCGNVEGIDFAVLRNIEEMRILFPDQRISTDSVYEWCGGILSKRRIQRILTENFMNTGYGRYSNYSNPVRELAVERSRNPSLDSIKR